MEACWAHNPEVRGSKPRSAKLFFCHKIKIDFINKQKPSTNPPHHFHFKTIYLFAISKYNKCYSYIRSEMELRGKRARAWCVGSFQPVLYNCCNKGRGMCYIVCELVQKSLLLIGKSSTYNRK